MSNMYSLFTPVLVLALAGLSAASQNLSAGSTFSESSDTGVQWQTSFPRSVTYKELRLWNSQAGEGAVLSARRLHFGIVPVKTRLSRFLQVHNPTDRPIMVQLLLLPNNVEDLLRYGCSRKVMPYADAMLDDEEFDLQVSIPERCSSDEEEIEAVKDLSSQPLPSFPRFSNSMSILDKMRQYAIYCENRSLKKDKQSSRLNLLPRYKCGRKCLWVLSDPETNAYMLPSQSQGFFLTSKSRGVVVVAPHSSAAVGPVVFQGQAVGTFQGRVMVRSNATLFDVVEVSAEAKYARLAFRKETFFRQATTHHKLSVFTHSQEMETLTFDITDEDIENQYVSAPGFVRLPETIRVVKVYEAENLGTLPLLISGFLINGHSCSLMGITIENCGKAYLLQPRETVDVVVSYRVTFLQRELQVQLWIVTEEDSFYLPLEVTMHVEPMGKYVNLQATDRNSSAYFLSELCTLVNIIITTGYMVAVFQEVVADKNPKLRKSRVISTRLRVGKETFRMFVRLQSPVLHRKAVVPREEPVPVAEPTPIQEEKDDEEDVKPQLEVQKQKKKIKKIKSSILKYAPASDSPKSEKSSSQVVFATNKLLLAKKKPKRVDSSESVLCAADLESEKPGGKEACDSRTTTHSEDGEGEDEYLDDYKTRTGLFSGFSQRASS